MTDWEVRELTGLPSEHHARDLAPPVRRALWVFPLEGTTLVLGSTQPDDVVEQARARELGVAVVRRRSGGGAVLLDPGDVAVWADLVIPVGDPLWHDDVGRAAHVVGDIWSATLRSLGVEARVHTGGLEPSDLGRLVCFADLGPGEVTVDGRKVVGVSQRRTALGARFQTVLLRCWRPGRLVDLLALDERGRTDAVTRLTPVAGGVDLPTARVVEALRAQLPA